jgi:hypothetical protein
MGVFADALAWARGVCLGLPETYEEMAWVGTRWKVRSNTFAHVLEVVDGYPAAFSAAAGTAGPTTLLTFRAAWPELDAVLAGEAFFGPLWNRNDVGVRLGEDTDWDELGELLVESYRLRAPQRLARQLDA